MIVAQVNTIETQLIKIVFISKFTMGGLGRRTPVVNDRRCQNLEKEVSIIENDGYAIENN